MSGRTPPKAQKANLSLAPPRLWWLLGVLTVLGVAAYWNSFDAPLVFDDLLSIQRNTSVRFGEFNWNLFQGRALL